MYYLADSSGACIDNFQLGMTIRQYMYACGTQPSKLRIYVLQRIDVEVCDIWIASERVSHWGVCSFLFQAGPEITAGLTSKTEFASEGVQYAGLIASMSERTSIIIFFHLDKEIAENIDDIKTILHQSDPTPQPLGPVIDYITFIPTKNTIDSEALYSFLVLEFNSLSLQEDLPH